MKKLQLLLAAGAILGCANMMQPALSPGKLQKAIDTQMNLNDDAWNGVNVADTRALIIKQTHTMGNRNATDAVAALDKKWKKIQDNRSKLEAAEKKSTKKGFKKGLEAGQAKEDAARREATEEMARQGGILAKALEKERELAQKLQDAEELAKQLLSTNEKQARDLQAAVDQAKREAALSQARLDGLVLSAKTAEKVAVKGKARLVTDAQVDAAADAAKAAADAAAAAAAAAQAVLDEEQRTLALLGSDMDSARRQLPPFVKEHLPVGPAPEEASGRVSSSGHAVEHLPAGPEGEEASRRLSSGHAVEHLPAGPEGEMASGRLSSSGHAVEHLPAGPEGETASGRYLVLPQEGPEQPLSSIVAGLQQLETQAKSLMDLADKIKASANPNVVDVNLYINNAKALNKDIKRLQLDKMRAYADDAQDIQRILNKINGLRNPVGKGYEDFKKSVEQDQLANRIFQLIRAERMRRSAGAPGAQASAQAPRQAKYVA